MIFFFEKPGAEPSSKAIHARRTMARSNLELQIARSLVIRYGMAVLSVSAVLGGALLLERFHFRDVADQLFLLAIAVTVWYAGIGPAILAVVLSGLADTYFFIEPIYTLYITRDDLPHFAIFVLFASLLTWFAAIRRRVERDLVPRAHPIQKAGYYICTSHDFSPAH